MAVRIRLKRLGRRHRPFYRVCAMDRRTARNGRVIEELGTYDPMIKDTDARVTLKRDRIDYWEGFFSNEVFQGALNAVKEHFA